MSDSSHPTPPAPRPIPLELPAALEPIYSNLALIGHSPAEIVIDFARMLPGMPKARVAARVVLTPLCAKALMRALADNIAKFEKQYGEIHLPEGPSLAEQLFGKPTGDPAPESPKEG
ncbi:MAG: DUF3467 domain-containing protein [Anaerolineales bacterium]|nr:DUF3467 domain-containing protein [Anaerolineales bacterium]